MSLIIFPDAGWNTFASEPEAVAIIGGFVPSDGSLAFAALDTSGREAILKQTALQIKLCNKIKLPTDAEEDLKTAQCYLTVYALSVDMMSYDVNAKAITEEHAGAVGVTYDSSYKASDNTAFDPMTQALLSQYGCKSSNTGLSQSYTGRS